VRPPGGDAGGHIAGTVCLDNKGEIKIVSIGGGESLEVGWYEAEDGL